MRSYKKNLASSETEECSYAHKTWHYEWTLQGFPDGTGQNGLLSRRCRYQANSKAESRTESRTESRIETLSKPKRLYDALHLRIKLIPIIIPRLPCIWPSIWKCHATKMNSMIENWPYPSVSRNIQHDRARAPRTSCHVVVLSLEPIDMV